MLGAFDNYNLGYVDRGFALRAEHEKQIVPGGGIMRPAIVVDGALRRHLGLEAQRQAAGGRRSSPSPPLAPAIEAAIAAEVADVGRFEGVTATIPRR